MVSNHRANWKRTFLTLLTFGIALFFLIHVILTIRHILIPVLLGGSILLVVILLLYHVTSTSAQKRKETKRELWPIENLIEIISYYRPFGFLENLSGIPIEEAVEKLQSRLGPSFEPGWPKWETDSLAIFDENRFWFSDLESDVCEGNEVYLKVVQEWADISRGVFKPEQIQETWKSPKGPVRIDFHLNGTPQQIKAAYYDDFVDLGLLQQINLLIKDCGYRFEALESEDQLALVLVLSPEEKRRLEMERGWRFEKEPGLYEQKVYKNEN